MRRATDKLFPHSLSPREREAVRLIEQQPGITVAELREALGVGRARIWQIVERLEYAGIRRVGEAPRRAGWRAGSP